jgi:hypothetical protein
MVTITTQRHEFITPKRFGAKGGAKRASGITTTAASAVITGPTGTFKVTDVGLPIYVAEANTSGTVLISTIASFTSSTQVTLANPAAISLAGTGQILIGEDDTAAVQNAINYANSQGLSKSVLIDDNYITGPLTLYKAAPLVGIGRTAALILKPGSATVNKHHIKPATLTDSLTIQGVVLHGMRAFHTDGSGVVLKDIDGIKLDFTGASNDAACYVTNVVVRDYGRAGLKLSGKGRSTLSTVVSLGSGYGIEVDSADNTFSNVTTQALGPGMYLTANALRNHFSAVRAYKCGYSPINNVAAEYCTWSLNSACNNVFSNCEGAESWASNWYMFDAKRNSFVACRATDTGCLFSADGLGADNSAQTRAGWALNGSSDDNRFYGSSVGVGTHGTSNYATHGMLFNNAAAGNTGRVDTDKNAAAFGTAKIGRSTSGVGNTVRVDGESVSPDRHMLPVHVSQFFRQLTNGPGPAEVELPTNKILVATLNFDPTTPESAQARIPMPPSWDGGAFTYDVKFSQISAGAGGVAWGLKAVALSDNSAKDVASGTEVIVTKTAGTANNEYVTPESTAVTAAGATTGKITLLLTITRAVGDAADTLNQDVRLEEVRLYVNMKQENDA